MLLLAATERVLHQAGRGAEPEEHHCHCCRSAEPEEHHCHYSHCCNCNGAAQEYWIHRKLRSNIASKVLRPLLYFKRPFVEHGKYPVTSKRVYILYLDSVIHVKCIFYYPMCLLCSFEVFIAHKIELKVLTWTPGYVRLVKKTSRKYNFLLIKNNLRHYFYFLPVTVSSIWKF